MEAMTKDSHKKMVEGGNTKKKTAKTPLGETQRVTHRLPKCKFTFCSSMILAYVSCSILTDDMRLASLVLDVLSVRVINFTLIDFTAHVVNRKCS